MIFELVVYGFDGSSDETDDRVLWVEAEDKANVLAAVDGLSVQVTQAVALREASADFDLSAGEAQALREHIEGLLPDRSPWIICPECRGEGKSSAYLGAITQEDRERDWDPDSWDDYMNGAYDRICDCCNGTGKVREKACEDYLERKAEIRSESWHFEY